MHKRTFIRWIALSSIGVAALTSFVVIVVILSPLPLEQRKVIFVPEGQTMLQLLDSLGHVNAIRYPLLWKGIAWVGGRFRPVTIYMGSYELSPELTHAELFRNLLTGRNRLIRRFTIFEGETTQHLAGSLARVLDDDSTRIYRLIVGDSLARVFRLEGARSLEGYLLPATYELYEREPVEYALNRMVRHFETVWNQRFAARCLQTGLSRQQVLVLASIIEGEVRNPIEYRRIAGVYWNRLSHNMKLEADPTVQYALGFPSRRLTFQDYRIEHPYNTYRIAGLPPGPIKAPSVRAIDAVLSPEEHEYLYFCSSGDSTGTHRFARTFREHRTNVRSYYRALQEGATLSNLSQR